MTNVLSGIALIIVLAVSAQWVAWRMRLPSILILLTVGFIAGPILRLVDPDALMGDLLFPLVSLAVGLIMFEGALGLRFAQIANVRAALRNMLSIGMLTTWVLSSVAAHFILRFDWPLAILLGAILVVTGPTVIGPLLRHVKPVGPVGPILRWEGILIDPIGATLGLLVLEFVLAASPQVATTSTVVSIVKTLVVGTATGLFGAGLVYVLLRRYLVPDYLHNPLTLMIVVGVFALADLGQHESGLLAVTIMGIALANQKRVPVQHIVQFKENLGVLLIGSLFILLSARLRLDDLTLLGGEIVLFLIVMLLIVRPASIALSTIGSALSWQERAFLSWMAPRGIVAAAITSIFALRLEDAGFEGARLMVPVMFSVIVGTVAVYGLTALPVARWLGVARRTRPDGAIIVGAHDWAREIGRVLRDHNYFVVLVDTNHDNIQQARMDGLPTHFGSVLNESSFEEVDLNGIGRILALTSNDEVNALAALHAIEAFGRAEVYQLPLRQRTTLPEQEVPGHLHGRFLFSKDATFHKLEEMHQAGAVIKATMITREFDYNAFQKLYGDRTIPLFLIDKASKRLSIFATDTPLTPTAGQVIISMALPVAESNGSGTGSQAMLTEEMPDGQRTP
jgi:NhaP-type Na+/H+ or K+/H+ antiporter